MSKQKRNYSIARIRPTSYSHAYTSQEFEKNDNKNRRFFSNLLHNYEKLSKPQVQTPKLTFLQQRKDSSGKVTTFDVELKQLDRKFPHQSPFLSQRTNFNRDHRRISNYSLYLQKSLTKQSRKTSSHRQDSSPRFVAQMSKSELLEPCKITSIKIQNRRLEFRLLQEHKDSAEFIRKRNKKGKFQISSQLNIVKRFREDMIEPWGLKNYESIML